MAARDAQVDGDASGNLSCAMAQGQPMVDCPYVVGRAEGGTARVVATRPDGSTRTLYFHKGKAIGAETTGSAESYRLPEAVVFGS